MAVEHLVLPLVMGLGMKDALSGDFVNMGTVALGDYDVRGGSLAPGAGIDNETAGVSALALVYTGIEGLKVQAWDYIAWDILNAIYLDADYTIGINESCKNKIIGSVH